MVRSSDGDINISDIIAEVLQGDICIIFANNLHSLRTMYVNRSNFLKLSYI